MLAQGEEDLFKMNKYVFVFQREYVEAEGELRWLLADMTFHGNEDVMI